MGLLLAPPTAPDLLMSDDGRVLGLRDGKGVVRVRFDRFVPTPGRGGAARAAPSAGSPACSWCLKCALQKKAVAL